MQLRPNQVEPTRLGVEFFQKKDAEPSIIVAPTAFGKSIVIAHIADSVDDNLLILQPSKELLEQNFSKYIALGGHAEIYSASFNSRRIGDVTYATIGSIKSLGARFKELGFKKMIIDEAHLYPRESTSMLGTFLRESGITHVLGLTATPLKLQTNMGADGDPFSKLVMLTSRSKKGGFFKDIIYVSQVSEMVELGFWSKIEYEQYEINETGLVYNSTKAEFTEESIEAVYKSNNIGEKVRAKIKQCRDRNSVIVFVPSVSEAVQLANETPDAVAIYGDMNKKDRAIAINGFKTGRIKVIYNVNVLSVGFDHPRLDTIICARSTASLAWFYQAMGRGTRIHPDKQDCLIVDFSGNVKRFGKLEKLYFKKENTWKLYGEDNKLLTGCPLHEIGVHTEESESKRLQNKKPVRRKDGKVLVGFGKHKDLEVKDTPQHWRDWIYEEFNKNESWNKWNIHVKKEIERIKNEKQVVNA